ncbi:hypothetical protein DUI87_29668 [Hirundo rustica rustica]|uniref:Cilia- and flagella-associated protein 45 n=1 Tax=Hirundo rustica rustica TaxID=333673 RepID=A0A3M0IZQ4_HIRRU|nr:hypothetical protein DUI87_29668 [Hirundo rustica rustica]
MRKVTGSRDPAAISQDVPQHPRERLSVKPKLKTIRVITKDLIRDLIIPQEKPEPCLIIGEKEYERIKESAQAPTEVEHWDRLKTLRARQDAAFETLKKAQLEEQRKAELEDKRDRGSDREEQQEQQEKQKLLQRAARMRLEQDEEMRALNALFLSAKCNMIRDKQVLEKQMIHKELAEEEKRLDKMMEMERDKGMEVQEELERHRKQELMRWAQGSLFPTQASGPFPPHQPRLCQRCHAGEQDGARGNLVLSYCRARQDIVKQMEQNAEERALRAEELYQEGQRQLERLEQMKREDRKVGAGNRGLQGGFHLAGKGLAVLHQPRSGSRDSSQRDQSCGPMGTVWHPWEMSQSLPALSEEEEEEGALSLVAFHPAWHFQAWEQKQEKLKQIHAEIRRLNVESQRLKDQQHERERLEDERVLEQQRQKAEREAAWEAEQEQLRLEKEKELARLRAMQEQAQDWQAELDALRAKRNQEVADREWRRQELEKARKKAELEQQLRQDRLEQVAQKEQYLAMQVEQDRQEFQRVLKAHQEQLEREKLEREQRELRQRAHAQYLRQQIQELQQQRERERAAVIEEGRQQEQELRQRRQRLAQLRQQKLQEFRATGIPDKYRAHVERRAQSRASAASS